MHVIACNGKPESKWMSWWKDLIGAFIVLGENENRRRVVDNLAKGSC